MKKTEQVKSIFANGALNHLQLLEAKATLPFNFSIKWYISRGIIKVVGSVLNPMDRESSPLSISLYNVE